MKDWKCASVRGWPERMIAAKSHSISSGQGQKASATAPPAGHTFVKICLVEIIRPWNVHIIQASDLSLVGISLLLSIEY